jgi:hypothetical protein
VQLGTGRRVLPREEKPHEVGRADGRNFAAKTPERQPIFNLPPKHGFPGSPDRRRAKYDGVMAMRSRPVRRVTTMALALVFAMGGAALAQFGLGGFRDLYQPLPNSQYDGRFTFARVRYRPAPGGFWPGRRPSWIHGYPLAERNLIRIMNEVSLLGASEDINTVTLDDPELFKYPIAYLIEVGWWTVNSREAAGLRAYLQKGGFLFVDDFKPAGWRGVPGGGWEPFADTMRKVLPDVQFLTCHRTIGVPLVLRDQRPQSLSSGVNRRRSDLQGIFEDNDRSS